MGVCSVCGQKTQNKKYCSLKCCGMAARRRPRKKHACVICGQTTENRKYCGRECWAKGQIGRPGTIQSGIGNPFWGHSHSPETRAAMSIAKKKQGLAPWRGKHLPDAMKRKISQSKKGCKVGWSAEKRRHSPESRTLQGAARREWWARWRQQHPEYKAEALLRERVKARNRRVTDMNYRLRKNLCCRIRSALRGRTKSGHTKMLIGCSIEMLRTHLEKQFAPGMTWENYGKWHVDHILPCISFDLTDPAQQRECFHFINLQPLWARENLQKQARVLAEVA